MKTIDKKYFFQNEILFRGFQYAKIGKLTVTSQYSTSIFSQFRYMKCPPVVNLKMFQGNVFNAKPRF